LLAAEHCNLIHNPDDHGPDGPVWLLVNDLARAVSLIEHQDHVTHPGLNYVYSDVVIASRLSF
jgi:hypothetical protein